MSDERVIQSGGRLGKSIAVAAALAHLVGEDDEPADGRTSARRTRRAFKERPTVAQVIHREHDGPDPAELPRRRRRMPFPPRSMFHTSARERRPKRG